MTFIEFMLSPFEDIKETLVLLYDRNKANMNQVHKGLLGLVFTFLNVNLILFILFCIFAPKQVDKLFEAMETNPSIVVALVILPVFITIILQATITYISKFNQTVLSDNERVNLDNRVYCSLSLFCNFLFLIARILIYIILLVYGITILQTIIEMHILIDRGTGKLERFAEYIGTFFSTLGQKKDWGVDATGLVQISSGVMNEKVISLNNLFNPLYFFRQVSSNFVNNWRGHCIVLLNGSILSIILGFFGIDFKRECKDTDTTYEKRIKTQFTVWLVILSLVVCISYVIILVYNIANQ